MKHFYLLATMLFALVGTASAEADITVEAAAVEGHLNRFEIIVSMTNDENEVRDMECTFTLPQCLAVVDKPTYNKSRFDGYVATLDIRDNHTKATGEEEASKFTFLSLNGDYVTESEGEIFRFTVDADEDFKETGNIAFDFEIVNKDIKAETFTRTINIEEVNPYTVSLVEEKVSLEAGEATVTLAIENKYVAVGGLEMVIELPEGLEIATNSKGKVAWAFTDRVCQSKNVSERKLANNAIKLMVIDANSEALIEAGEGEFVSFNVKAAEGAQIPEDCTIVIRSIKVSKTSGRQFTQDGTLSVSVESSDVFEAGDVNRDGNITLADLTTLVNILMVEGVDTTNYSPDVNGDGKITLADYTTLINIIMAK